MRRWSSRNADARTGREREVGMFGVHHGASLLGYYSIVCGAIATIVHHGSANSVITDDGGNVRSTPNHATQRNATTHRPVRTSTHAPISGGRVARGHVTPKWPEMICRWTRPTDGRTNGRRPSLRSSCRDDKRQAKQASARITRPKGVNTIVWPTFTEDGVVPATRSTLASLGWRVGSIELKLFRFKEKN